MASIALKPMIPAIHLATAPAPKAPAALAVPKPATVPRPMTATIVGADTVKSNKNCVTGFISLVE